MPVTPGEVPLGDPSVLDAAVADEPAVATVVVGFDHSPSSLEALRTAAGLGDRLRAHLAVLHAVDLSDHPLDPEPTTWRRRAVWPFAGAPRRSE